MARSILSRLSQAYSTAPARHCERSEAIDLKAGAGMDGFVAMFLKRNNR